MMRSVSRRYLHRPSTEAAEIVRIDPKFTLDFWAKTSAYKEQSVRDNLINALRKAGLK